MLITGRVQGVYYRASTQQRAEALGLSGWIMNTPSGAVELEAQGPEDAVKDLIAWCHDGPPAARVDHVALETIAAREHEAGFVVRR